MSFMRQLKAASTIVLSVVVLSMMTNCGGSNEISEKSNLTSSDLAMMLNPVAPGGILECTIHVVNTGSATEAEVTAELLPQMSYVPNSEWASSGEVRVGIGQDTIYWEGDVPAADEVTFGFQALVGSLEPGQPVFGGVLIYDTLTGEQCNLDEAASFRPNIEYEYDGWGMMESFTQYHYDAPGNLISEETTSLDKRGAPAGGATTEYDYNAVGNRISEEMANFGERRAPAGGANVEYEYDSLNRLIHVERTDLDKQGRSTGDAITEYQYGAMEDQVSKETTNFDENDLPAGSRVTEYERDEQGRVTKVTVTNYDEDDALTGSTVTEYGYDDEGRVKTVDVTNYDENDTQTGGTLTQYGHDYEGRVTTVDVTNYDENDAQTGGTLTQYGYDYEGRVTTVSVTNYDKNDAQTGGTLTQYGYDYEGRVTSVSVGNYDENDVLTGGTATEYEYDEQGRVKSVDVYSYDENSVITGGTATDYEYDEQGRVKSVDVYSYDENSVITGGTATDYEYDDEGRVTRVELTSYDEDSAITGTTVAEYEYDEQGIMTKVSQWVSDSCDDLYNSAGYPASGPDWQDITEVDAVCSSETITFTLTFYEDFPAEPVFSDGAVMILIDVDGDGEVVPPQGTIDFYGGNLDYGVFIPSPEFGEPPIFVDDLQLMGTGEYDTEGAQYSVDGNKIEIEVQLDHIGDPGGSISFVAAVRTGIMSGPIEDRLPNEGLVQMPDP